MWILVLLLGGFPILHFFLSKIKLTQVGTGLKSVAVKNLSDSWNYIFEMFMYECRQGKSNEMIKNGGDQKVNLYWNFKGFHSFQIKIYNIDGSLPTLWRRQLTSNLEGAIITEKTLQEAAGLTESLSKVSSRSMEEVKLAGGRWSPLSPRWTSDFTFPLRLTGTSGKAASDSDLRIE